MKLSNPQAALLIVLILSVCVTGAVLSSMLGQLIAPGVPMPTQTIAIEIITTAKGVFSVPGPAYLDGRDLDAQPPLTIMSIYIWDAVPRAEMVCALPHAARVSLLEAYYYQPEGRFYFRVEAGACRGWLPEPFVSDAAHAPVGDHF